MIRFLVGFDGSPASRRAARLAAQLALAQRAQLLLVKVVPEPWPNSPLAEGSAGLQAINEHELATAEAALRAEADELLGARTRVVRGRPAEALAAIAAELDVALVVVGHRDRGVLGRAFAGSVAIRLVKTCSKPVLVFRDVDSPPASARSSCGADVHPLRGPRRFRNRAAQMVRRLAQLLKGVIVRAESRGSPRRAPLR